MKIQFKQPPTAFETNGLAVQYAPSKRDLPSWRWRVLVILVLAPLLVFLARVIYRSIFVTMPGFVTIDHTVIKTPLAGRLVQSVHVGENVRAGDVIAQLQNQVLDSQLDALTTALAAARQRAKATRDTDAHAARVAALRASALPLLRLRQQQYDNVRYLVDMRAATQRDDRCAGGGRSARAKRQCVSQPRQAMAAPLPWRRQPLLAELPGLALGDRRQTDQLAGGTAEIGTGQLPRLNADIAKKIACLSVGYFFCVRCQKTCVRFSPSSRPGFEFGLDGFAMVSW